MWRCWGLTLSVRNVLWRSKTGKDAWVCHNAQHLWWEHTTLTQNDTKFGPQFFLQTFENVPEDKTMQNRVRSWNPLCLCGFKQPTTPLWRKAGAAPSKFPLSNTKALPLKTLQNYKWGEQKKERLLIWQPSPNPGYLRGRFISLAHKTFQHSRSLGLPLMEM